MFEIDREYKQNEVKNRNELPFELLSKMILYSSDPGNTVCDLFLGGGSTAIVAKGLGRIPTGFEINKNAFDMAVDRISATEKDSMLDLIRTPEDNKRIYGGKPWTDEERQAMIRIVDESKGLLNKREVIEKICEELKMGKWGVQNELDRMGILMDPHDRFRCKADKVLSDSTTQMTLNDLI